jgi:hypothetical protein
MSAIKAKQWFDSKIVLVKHKDLRFRYRRPEGRNLARKGRFLEISTVGRTNMTISLNGTQINTLKKILKAAGEI